SGMDARWRDSRAGKLSGQRHGKAPRVGRADQLLGVGGRPAFFKAGLEGIRPVKGAAADFQPSAALSKISLPFCFGFVCWHKVSFLIGYWYCRGVDRDFVFSFAFPCDWN